MFCRSVLVLFLGHCVVCSSSIYGFRVPLWYLQTLLIIYLNINIFTVQSEDTYYIELSGNSSTPRLLNVYQCDNGEYISSFAVCNGYFDCVDNSDEVNCGE